MDKENGSGSNSSKHKNSSNSSRQPTIDVNDPSSLLNAASLFGKFYLFIYFLSFFLQLLFAIYDFKAYWGGRDPSAAAAAAAAATNPLFGSPFGASLGMLPTSNANDRFSMSHQQQQQQQVNKINSFMSLKKRFILYTNEMTFIFY